MPPRFEHEHDDEHDLVAAPLLCASVVNSRSGFGVRNSGLGFGVRSLASLAVAGGITQR